jgi:hypothetical protein
MLDFDGPLPSNFLSFLTTCAKLWQWPLEAVRIDKTKRGYHVVIGVKKRLPDAFKVASQAILGSDRKREAFNLMRVSRLKQMPKFWRDRWNVLYASHLHGLSVVHRGHSRAHGRRTRAGSGAT